MLCGAEFKGIADPSISSVAAEAVDRRKLHETLTKPSESDTEERRAASRSAAHLSAPCHGKGRKRSFEAGMYLEDKFPGGGGESWCCACKQPIREGERRVQIAFNNDPTGDRGLSGAYHHACSKPFTSLAHIVNLNPWTGR